MTISATCPKGHTLTLEEKLAGKKIRCPRCQTVFEVPRDNGDEWEDDEEEAVSEKPIRRSRRREDDDEDDEDDRPRARARRRDDDDDDDDDRPRKKAPVRYYDDDDDDEEEMDDKTRRKLERQLKKKQLKLVDVGLLLHYIKLMIYIIGIILGITMAILLAVAGAQMAEALEAGAKGAEAEAGGVQGFVVFGTVTVMALVSFLLILVMSQIAPLLGIVGSFLCCWIPKKSECRGTIITSLTFDLVSMITGLLGMLAGLGVFGMERHKVENMQLYLQMITWFCTISAWLTFLTFLRGLGKYLGEPGVGNEALNLIARLVVMVITLVIDFILIIAFGRLFVGLILAIIIAIGSAIIWFIIFVFVFFLRQLKLLSAMRRAVQNRL